MLILKVSKYAHLFYVFLMVISFDSLLSQVFCDFDDNTIVMTTTVIFRRNPQLFSVETE